MSARCVLTYRYLMLRTEDIPAMSGYAFEPAAIKGNALETLRWLQQTCTGESSTCEYLPFFFACPMPASYGRVYN